MPIVQAGDPILRRRAEEVPRAALGSAELDEVIDALHGSLEEVPGVGLAAPQIGISWRVVLVQDPVEYHGGIDEEVRERMERRPVEPYVLVNPRLEPIGSEGRIFFEGCLSVEGYRALVPRYRRVRVLWTDPSGVEQTQEVSGWHARILQHETDHLDGVLYVDRMLARSLVNAKTYPAWASLPTEEVLHAFGIAPPVE
jgi:peptide deformylase